MRLVVTWLATGGGGVDSVFWGCPPHCSYMCLPSWRCVITVVRAVELLFRRYVLTGKLSAARGTWNTTFPLFLLLTPEVFNLCLAFLVPCGLSSWNPWRLGMRRRATRRAPCTRMTNTSRNGRRGQGGCASVLLWGLLRDPSPSAWV